jgi:peptidylprolyl isomerase
MKLKFPLIAAFVAMLSLTACGGGGGGSSSSSSAANPASFSAADTVLGTGTEAATGNIVAVKYTIWLYSDTATDHKGTQIDSNATSTVPLSFTLGSNQVIAGFDQGVTGMKVGGKRTLIIPSSMAYGASGYGSIPPNAGVVFDVELTNVGVLANPTSFSSIDTVVGTGAQVAAGNTVSVKYSAYLYSDTAADHKGILVDTNTTSTTAFTFTQGANQVVPGFDQGVVGMKVGGTRTLIVPASMAYGSAGSGSIPPNSGVVFDVQLTNVQ